MSRVSAPVIPNRWGEGRVAASLVAVLTAPGAALFAALVLLARAFRKPASWFPVFAWGLAVHISVVAFLYGTLGIPEPLVRIAAAWKEVAVVCVLLATVARTAAGRNGRMPLHAMDLIVASLVCISLAMLVSGETLLRQQPRPMGMRLYGFREACFFTALYCIGRATPELASNTKALKSLVKVGLVLSVIALLEVTFLGPQVLAVLGAPKYFREFLGVEMMTEGSLFGLPYYYFTNIGSRTVYRAGSLFLGSQGLAASFLLILPAATILLLAERRKRPLTHWLGYGVLWLGLLVTVSRMSTVATLIAVVLVLILLKRFEVVVAFSAVALGALLVTLAISPAVRDFVWTTLTWQTLSSASHSQDWMQAYYAMAEHPFGWGLGTADLTAAKYGYEPLTGDSLLLKYGVELGLAGLLLFAALLVGAAATAFAVFRYAPDPAPRKLGLLVFVATIGLSINGLTAVVTNLPFLAYIYFWLVGTTVAIRRRIEV